MRRIEQVRLSDWTVRTPVVLTFFASFVAPSRWMFPLVLFCFGAVGLWALFYLEGVLGWAKTDNTSLNKNDSSIWWAPRLIGAFFLVFVVVLELAISRQLAKYLDVPDLAGANIHLCPFSPDCKPKARNIHLHPFMPISDWKQRPR
jgi:hypothetical protein